MISNEISDLAGTSHFSDFMRLRGFENSRNFAGPSFASPHLLRGLYEVARSCSEKLNGELIKK